MQARQDSRNALGLPGRLRLDLSDNCVGQKKKPACAGFFRSFVPEEDLRPNPWWSMNNIITITKISMATNFPAVRMALSPGRTSTYLDALKQKPPHLGLALDLYVWNAKLGAALMSPISVCEVVIRNAVSDALTLRYGPQWPWSTSFHSSLNDRGKKALEDARNGETATGKVIAEFSFGFWENMFVTSFDYEIWNSYLNVVLPNLPAGNTVRSSRGHMRQELEKLRLLRNRIAHHEPILTINAAVHLQRVEKLVGYRCFHTAAWVVQTNSVAALIGTKPS